MAESTILRNETAGPTSLLNLRHLHSLTSILWVAFPVSTLRTVRFPFCFEKHDSEEIYLPLSIFLYNLSRRLGSLPLHYFSPISRKSQKVP